MDERNNVTTESWDLITLGEFLSLQRGHDLTQEERRIGTVPVFGAAGQNGYHNKAIAKGPGIVIGRSGGSFGQVHFIKDDFWPHNTALYVVDFKGNDPYFIFYLLKLLDFSSLNSGSAQPSLNRNFLYPIPIKVPKALEQRKISKVLSVLDNKIDLNNRITADLEAMAKVLYDYWFVQFDFPNKNGNPYKSSGGKMVYNEKLKQKIPNGWKVESLTNLALSLVRGISPKYVEDGGISVLNQKCIRNKSIDFSLARKHDFFSKKVDSKLIQVGDILVNSTGVGTLGRVAIVKRLEESITTVDSHITIVRIDHEKANPTYAGYALAERQSDIEQFGQGSTGQTELSRENLGKLMLIIPEKEMQCDFETILRPILQKISANEKENQELILLRDFLLPRLITGQVKVHDSFIIKGEIAEIPSAQLPVDVKQISLPIPVNKIGFAKQVLAAKIVSLFNDDPNFTDIKFQKVQFLAEHLIQADLNLNYYYQAAGPYDNKFMHTIYDSFKINKWFDRKNKQFTPLDNESKIEGYYQGYFKPAIGMLNTIFDLLADATEAESEIIATLYAVWNNRLIERKSFKDEELMEDFYHWSERKKMYSKSQIVKGMQWLRNNHMEPVGFGKVIRKAKNKR